MFTLINSMYGPFKAVCQHILNVYIDICPNGVLGNLLGMVVFVLVTGAAVSEAPQSRSDAKALWTTKPE